MKLFICIPRVKGSVYGLKIRGNVICTLLRCTWCDSKYYRNRSCEWSMCYGTFDVSCRVWELTSSSVPLPIYVYFMGGHGSWSRVFSLIFYSCNIYLFVLETWVLNTNFQLLFQGSDGDSMLFPSPPASCKRKYTFSVHISMSKIFGSVSV